MTFDAGAVVTVMTTYMLESAWADIAYDVCA